MVSRLSHETKDGSRDAVASVTVESRAVVVDESSLQCDDLDTVSQ